VFKGLRPIGIRIVFDFFFIQKTNHSDIYVCLLMHVLIGDDDQIVIDHETPTQNKVEEKPTKSFSSRFTELFKRKSETSDNESSIGMDSSDDLIPIAQHYNPDRSLIYDEVKSSRQSNLTVAVEQVSIFLIHDGTVITFFQVLDHFLFGETLTVAIGQSRRRADCATIGIWEYYSSKVRGCIIVVTERH
jgi:hypothetical protein